MRTAVFVAPWFLETTLRFINAAATLPGVRLALVSTDPEEKLPGDVRSRLAGHYRVSDCLEPKQLVEAVTAIRGRLGGADRLLGTLEELQVPLAEARRALSIEGMSVEAARNFRDKSAMKDVLRRAGLPCARHHLAESSAEALDFVRQVGYPVVAKPPAGAGARNTYRIDNDDALRQCLQWDPPSAGRPVLLEEFVVGQEHSFDSIFVRGRPAWHSISHYYPTPLDVLSNPWIQWCVLLPRHIAGQEYDDIREVAGRSLKALGLETGLTHMEWFRKKDGSLAVSEVAARPPGAQFTTLISYAHDFDFYRGWAQLMIFEEFAPPPRAYAAGAAFLRGQGQGRIKAIHGLAGAHREIGSLVVESKLPRYDQSPSGTYEGDGYVILRHPDTDRVAEGLKRLVSLIRVELG